MQNLLELTEYSLRKKEWSNGLSKYTQSNCQCTLTDDGYRIYRTPNVNPTDNGSTMWGGLVIYPFNVDSNILQKGHRYVLMFHVKGKTSNTVCDVYFSNNVGWGGGGLNPNPTINKNSMNLPSNFNGETDVIYDFTINDDIYKVCTASYGNGAFVAGNTYLSYKGFKFGFSYTDTGSMGTDLYITNIRMYDITNPPSSYKINKNGIISFSSVNEITGGTRVNKYSEILTEQVYEY